VNGGALPVALDASPLRGGFTGVGRYVEQLLAHAPPDRVRYALLTNRPLVPPAAARLIPGPRLRPTLVWLQVAAPRLIAQSAAAVAHFTTGRAPLRSPVPVVLTVHDLTVLDHPEWYPARERLLVAPWLRASIRRAAAVIAVSEATAEDVRQRFPAVADRVHVIPEAAAPAFHRPVDPASVAAVRRRLGLGTRVWLHVGPPSDRKNTLRLVDAFARALPHVAPPRPRLVLAGSGGGRARDVARRVRALGLEADVRRIGYVAAADLPLLYASAEIVALPSLHEGFGLAAAEAMAVGAPILTGDRGGLPEVVGDASWRVDPTSTDDIAAGLVRLAGDAELRAALGERGRAQARRFDWQRAADRTADLYESVAAAAVRS